MFTKRNEEDVLLTTFNVGFALPFANGHCFKVFALDEYDDLSLYHVADEDLTKLLQSIYNLFKKEMDHYRDRQIDMVKLETLDLLTIDVEQFALKPNPIFKIRNDLLENAGNIALLEHYEPEFIQTIFEFYSKHYTETYTSFISGGKESRQGVSMFERYQNITKEFVDSRPDYIPNLNKD